MRSKLLILKPKFLSRQLKILKKILQICKLMAYFPNWPNPSAYQLKLLTINHQMNGMKIQFKETVMEIR